MIEAIDDRLAGWVRSVLGDGLSLSFGPPSDETEGVSLYLLALGSAPPLRGPKRPPLAMKLRYLVSAWSTDPVVAHRALSTLVFAAMDDDDFEVELDPLAVADWRAFSATPRPCFALVVPARKAREERPVQLVRAPMTVELSPARAVSGVVLGPGDLTVAGATVKIPALALSTRTDRSGRFRFARVPSARSTTLSIEAKGWHRTFTLRPGDASSEVRIRLEPRED